MYFCGHFKEDILGFLIVSSPILILSPHICILALLSKSMLKFRLAAGYSAALKEIRMVPLHEMNGVSNPFTVMMLKQGISLNCSKLKILL